MMFARRTGWDRGSNDLSLLLERLKASGTPVVDGTESNPTRCGIDYPPELLTALSDPANLMYTPESQGMAAARQAVGRFLGFDPRNVLLTASTSESYSFLFRLLLDPGDKVLVPKPSYPLFQFLLDINDAGLSHYPLVYDGTWRIDFAALEDAVDSRTKAIVLVNPNNPTGSYLKPEELDRLNVLCQRHNLAIIADEVFFQYALADGRFVSLQGNAPVLTFVLGGLSKTLGLPQMKLGWMLVSGPGGTVCEAMERLDIIADTFLSVNTPVQNACAGWLAQAPAIQSPIRQRTAANFAHLQSSGLPFCRTEGGWYAVLSLPGIDEESFVLDLLERRHVLVHPGFFFDFDTPGHLVVSLLPKPDQFARILDAIK